MTAKNSNSKEDLPKAKLRKRKWNMSLIWAVPIAAALVAGYLVYQRVREYGSTLTIQFRDVKGLKVGQTPIQYRGADIGDVTDIQLGPDQEFATVKVRLRRFASSIAREGSAFWIVRPQLAMGNFTGLGTIITGPYIEVLPGRGERAAKFVAVEHSPRMIDPNGLKLILLSDHSGSLRSGVPISYRGIEVGAVRESRLSTNASFVEIHCVIRRNYAPLVRAGSKFWNVTGLDVQIGLFKGAELNVESLKSLMIGGIAFATPDESQAGPVRDGMAFALHEKPEEDWLKWAPQIAVRAEDESGLPAVDVGREMGVPQSLAR